MISSSLRQTKPGCCCSLVGFVKEKAKERESEKEKIAIQGTKCLDFCSKIRKKKKRKKERRSSTGVAVVYTVCFFGFPQFFNVP